ncbi:hypothetical protein D3C76_1441360 [compost metagenome]
MQLHLTIDIPQPLPGRQCSRQHLCISSVLDPYRAMLDIHPYPPGPQFDIERRAGHRHPHIVGAHMERLGLVGLHLEKRLAGEQLHIPMIAAVVHSDGGVAVHLHHAAIGKGDVAGLALCGAVVSLKAQAQGRRDGY